MFTKTSGQVTRVESVTLAQPSGSASTVVRLAIGTDGATTRVFEYEMPSGAQFRVFHPGFTLTSTETIQASSVTTDDVVVCTINGYSEHAITL